MHRPAVGSVLVGRDQELRLLADAATSLAAGRGGLVWIEGEPGIGKSALLEAFLATHTLSGVGVYRAAGDEFSQRMPLRLTLDALGALAEEEVGALLRTVPSGESLVPAAVERVLALVDRRCANGPVVLILDDMHWADEASLVVWRRLARAVEQLPLLLVAACRPVPVGSPVGHLRRAVADRGVLVELAGLGTEEMTALVERLAGAQPGDRLRELAARAGGNPLYAEELLHTLARTDRLRLEAGVAELVGEALELPSVAAAISARLGFLSQRTTEVLRLAAVLGSEFSVQDLVTLTGRPAMDLLGDVQEAVASGVLGEIGSRLVFRHGLIRQALYEATPASVRAATHRQAAQALAAAGLPVDRVAAHLVADPDVVDGWVLDWLVEHRIELAGRAPDLAANLLGTAVSRCAGDDARRHPLLHGLAVARLAQGRIDKAEEAARQAVASATGPVPAAESAIVLAWILRWEGRLREAADVCQTAMGRADLPPVWRARLRARRASVMAFPGATDDRAAVAAEARAALADGEALGDRVATSYALYTLLMLPDLESGLAHGRRALTVIGDDPQLVDLKLSLLINLMVCSSFLGRSADVEAAGREALIFAERIGAFRLDSTRVWVATAYAEIGRWDEARAEVQHIGSQLDLRTQILRFGALAFIAAHRDDRAAAAELLAAAPQPEKLDDLRGDASLLLMAHAVSAEQAGRPAEAAAALVDTLGMQGLMENHDRHLWLADLVRLAIAADQPALATSAVTAAEQEAADDPIPLRTLAARLARAILGEDVPTLHAVAEEYHALGLHLQRGKSLEEAAVLLARAGDLPAARAAHNDAVRAYLELDAAWDVRRADARMRPYGVRRGSWSLRRRTSTGWEALTPTEERVAALVATGRSNPDIAAEMLLSRRTVQSHVSNILTKLGYHSRVEIAQEAGRRASVQS